MTQPPNNTLTDNPFLYHLENLKESLELGARKISESAQVLSSAIGKVVKKILEIVKTVLFFPVVGYMYLSEGSKAYLHRFSYNQTGVDPLLCKHKVTAKNPVVLDTSEASYSWKKALVENAKQSIEISAYCGGRPFQEILEIIEHKLQENPNFKARILTSTYTINPEEYEKFGEMMARYPNNFEVVVVPIGHFTYGPKMRRHENHTKMVIADQKYCIIGGSTHNNLILPHGEVKKAGGKMSFMADGLCDVDLAAEGEIAEAMKIQFDQVWMKWKHLCNAPPKPELDKGHHFTADQERVTLPQFTENKVEDSMDCTVILSLPEQGKKNLSKLKYLKLINQATSSIEIANASFNEKKTIDAIEQAIRRGVKVSVITNTAGDQAATTAFALSVRSRANYQRLMSAAQESNGFFKIYEYQKEDVLFHPKLMVVDEKTAVIGTVNITHESMKCDDEEILITKSKAIVDRLLRTYSTFKDDSKEVTEDEMSTCSFKRSSLLGKIMNTVLKNITD